MDGQIMQRNIVLRGIVEGVGMRPALYRFSVAHGVHGFVRNRAGAVELLWQGEALEMEEAFFDLRYRNISHGSHLVKERQKRTYSKERSGDGR